MGSSIMVRMTQKPNGFTIGEGKYGNHRRKHLAGVDLCVWRIDYGSSLADMTRSGLISQGTSDRLLA